MKKKLWSVLLLGALTAAVALTGCGSKEASGGDSAGGDSGEKKSIVLFQRKVEIMEPLMELAEEYEAETGVHIEVQEATGDDFGQHVMTKLTSGQGPTIFSIAPGTEAETYKDYLADLSDLSFVDKIPENMQCTYEGKVVGIPYTAEGFGLVVNNSMVDASKLTDTDSLVKYMEEKKAEGVNGLELTQEDYFLIAHILNTPFALQEDPIDFVNKLNNGEVKMADTPEFQEFAKIYEAIRANNVNPLEVNYDKQIGDFATGKAAAIHQGNWAASMFSDYQMDFEMSLMPVPINGNDKLCVAVPTAWTVNSQAPEEEQKLAKDFLEWLYTSEKGQDYLMNKFGFIPVVEGMKNDNLDKLSQDVAAYIQEDKVITWPMQVWPNEIIGVYLAPVAQEFFTSDMSGAEFLVKLDEAWAEAVSK